MMKRASFYRQCVLQKMMPQGRVEQVSYLPEGFGVAGRHVALRLPNGVWEAGWKVIQAGERQPAPYVESRARGHLRMRSVSDI